MYFKSLQLHGFKSFADKTKLDFVDGVTAVVGPNGSGKSNIADAMRWVMGEMSAKSLRGSKMEDVIFNGTDKRSPMAYAEVAIVMDNRDRSLNMDYDEITVSRRVYRSGESEYMINKAACRLKDIHELFMDTGLGRDGYSIIGQGKIDEILSAKSEDRRHIFDEAANITKYRYKKEEAERKLAQTNDNLLRIDDILTEIGNNLTPLEHQAKKAKKYLQLREVQKKLEINLWLRTLDSFDEQLSKIEQTFGAALRQKASLEEQEIAEENALLEKKEAYRRLEGLIDESRAGIYAGKNEITRVLGEIELARTNIENHKKDILRLEGEISLHKQKVAELKTQIAAKKEENSSLKEAHKETELALANLENEQKNVSAQLLDMNSKLRDMRESLSAKQAELSSNSAKIESSGSYFESLRERLTDILSEKSAAATRKLQIEQDMEKLAASLRENVEKAKTEQEKAASLNSHLTELKNKVAEKNAKSDELAVEQQSLSHKRITLESLENTFEGYPYSVRSVMNEVKSGSLKGNGIYGPLSQLTTTDSKYVTAVEAALGGALNHIVTDTEDDAKRAIAYLKSTKSGRATFLPISSVKGNVLDVSSIKSSHGYIGIAAELVRTDGKFKQIINAQIGKAVVVDNIDNAIALARKNSYKFKIVTLEGEVLSVGGSVSGGQSKGSSNALSRNAEIERIAKRLEEIAKERKKLLDEIETLNKQISESQAEYDSAQEQMWQSKSGLLSEKTALENLQLSLKSENAHIAALEKDSERVNDVIESTNAANEDILSGNKSLQLDIETLENDIAALETEADNYSARLAEITEKLGTARTESAVSLKDIEAAQLWVQTSENQVVSTEIEISNKSIHRETLREDIEKLEQNIAHYEEKVDELKAETTDGEGNIDKLSLRRENDEKEIEKKEVEIKEIKENIYKLREELARVESSKQRLEETREDIVTKMWEEYELTYSTADSLREDIGNSSDAQKQLSQTKAGIRSLGSVNVDSIEEYAAQKERHDFLSAQKSDLENAKSGLNSLISEMTTVMTEMFEDNFKKLNKTFGETFADLFGGGKAEIRLSDPDDVLGSGVEIDVQPPGKKLQSITLLSGGEKAFTAIALIFAILKIKPTYFCIFDEIEAALDDVNVFRYADYLKKFSEGTQFILITHRKGTMEVADTLYGVTMQEKGITKLLSLELDNYEE